MVPLIDNLDSLPFPDREMFDHNEYLKKQDSIQFLFNRGCPYQCTYCSNHALARVYGQDANHTRFRTPENCIEEIDSVLKKYNSNKPLLFVDDLFTLNKRWLYQFLDIYKKEIKRPFLCYTRCNLTSRELFSRLKEAGCYRVLMSIESGNDFIRNEVMKRNISREQILNSYQWAKSFGIETNGVAMVGPPFETKEMVWDTIKMIAETKPTFTTLNIFYPYKGTELYNVCKENGFLPDSQDQSVRERRESILNLDTLSKEDILYFKKNCQKLVRKAWPFRERINYFIQKHLNSLRKRIQKD